MIKKIIGQGYTADETDILQVKTALNSLGFYQIPSYGLTGFEDRNLYKAIKDFQRSRDLPVTGIIRPHDKTAIALPVGPDFDDEPDVRSPVMPCVICGAPHGGSHGDICPDCIKK